MEKVFRHYCKIWVRLWLDLENMSQSCGEAKLLIQDISNIVLEQKEGFIDLDAMAKIGEYSGDLGDVDNWDELQDKILRVLTYKYYEADVAVIYYNKSYTTEVSSLSYFDEELEIDTQILLDYEEVHSYKQEQKPNLEIEVLFRRDTATREQPEVVYIENSSRWMKFWKQVKDIITLRKCRKRKTNTDISDDENS